MQYEIILLIHLFHVGTVSIYLQTMSVTEEINDDRVSQSGNKMPTDSVTGLHNVSGTDCD
jgi:hypothetical protein